MWKLTIERDIIGTGQIKTFGIYSKCNNKDEYELFSD